MKAKAKIGSVVVNEKKYEENSDVNKMFFRIETMRLVGKKFHSDINYTYN